MTDRRTEIEITWAARAVAQELPFDACRQLLCEADDAGVRYELRCTLTTGHDSPCRGEWSEREHTVAVVQVGEMLA